MAEGRARACGPFFACPAAFAGGSVGVVAGGYCFFDMIRGGVIPKWSFMGRGFPASDGRPYTIVSSTGRRWSASFPLQHDGRSRAAFEDGRRLIVLSFCRGCGFGTS